MDISMTSLAQQSELVTKNPWFVVLLTRCYVSFQRQKVRRPHRCALSVLKTKTHVAFLFIKERAVHNFIKVKWYGISLLSVPNIERKTNVPVFCHNFRLVRNVEYKLDARILQRQTVVIAFEAVSYTHLDVYKRQKWQSLAETVTV